MHGADFEVFTQFVCTGTGTCVSNHDVRSPTPSRMKRTNTGAASRLNNSCSGLTGSVSFELPLCGDVLELPPNTAVATPLKTPIAPPAAFIQVPASRIS